MGQGVRSHAETLGRKQALKTETRYSDLERFHNLRRKPGRSWLPFISLPTQARVLELGSDLGELSTDLAGSASQLVCCDRTLDKVRFAISLCRHEGYSSVQGVQCDSDRIPFPEGSFDAIVVNHAPELTAGSERESGLEIQSEWFARLSTRLKKGGCLCLVAYNRYGIASGLGGATGSQVPPLEKMWSEVEIKQAPRAAQYSCKSLRRLLTSAGLKKLRFYAPLPGSTDVRYLIPLDEHRVFRFGLGKIFDVRRPNLSLLLSMASRFLPLERLVRLLVPEFLVLARR